MPGGHPVPGAHSTVLFARVFFEAEYFLDIKNPREAKHPADGRVVIKIPKDQISPGFIDNEEKMLKLLKGVKHLARLVDSYFIQVEKVLEDGEIIEANKKVLVLEKAKGICLWDLMDIRSETGGLSLQEVKEFGLEISFILKDLHDLGLV